MPLNKLTLHSVFLDKFSDVNQKLISGLDHFIDKETTRKSHHFFGRYENIYIDSEHIPEIDTVLTAAKEYAASILNTHATKLKAGLWFNVMNSGDKTTMHKHDDDDELLSAVYYVKVTKHSGTLLLDSPPMQIQVTPEAGMFVFFPPNMPHEVTENNSNECRISLGINIGPVD